MMKKRKKIKEGKWDEAKKHEGRNMMKKKEKENIQRREVKNTKIK